MKGQIYFKNNIITRVQIMSQKSCPPERVVPGQITQLNIFQRLYE